jgi:hypothetical protein
MKLNCKTLDNVMSVTGAAVSVALVVLKGRNILPNLDTNDCILCGALVAACTKFIAISRVAEVLKGAPAAPEPKTGEGA